MGRRSATASYWFTPLLILIIVSGISPGTALAQTIDEEFVVQLRAAQSRDDQERLVDVLAKRLESGAVEPEIIDALIDAILFSDTLHVFSHRLLPKLERDGFSDRALISLSRSLGSEARYHQSTLNAIRHSIHSARGPIPDVAFDALIVAANGSQPDNAAAAIGALANLSTDPARDRVVIDALTVSLSQADHPTVEVASLRGFETIAARVALPEASVAVLAEAAITNKSMMTRVVAARILSGQPIDTELANRLSESLASEIIDPSSAWRVTSGMMARHAVHEVVAGVLGALHEPPHPEHVTDAWIAYTRRYAPDAVVPLLKDVNIRNGLTPAQREALQESAVLRGDFDRRQSIYAVLYAAATSADVRDALRRFDLSVDATERIRAGHLLLSYFSDKTVPTPVADAAARIVKSRSDTETLYLAAHLLNGDVDDTDTRQRQLVEGLVTNAADDRFCVPAFRLLSDESLASLVLETAADEEVPRYFRSTSISRFGRLARSGGALGPEIEEVLVHVAESSDDSRVVQAAASALDAWGASVPVRARLMNSENQSRAIGFAFLGTGVISAIAGFVGLIAVVTMPLSSRTGARRGWTRFGLVFGWIILSFVMLVLLVIGFVGFIGHNSPPPPRYTLQFNIPAFIGATVYVSLAWMAFRRLRRSRAPSRVE